MKTVLAISVTGLLLCIAGEAAGQESQPVSCLNAYEDCMKDTRCSWVWILFNTTCKRQGCLEDIQDKAVCEAGYNTFMLTEYSFKNCRCDVFSPEFAECHYVQDTVFRSPCRVNTHIPSGTRLSYLRPITCTSAIEECMQDSECALKWTTYNQSCNADSEIDCSPNPNIDCRLLRHELDETTLKDCFCPTMGDNESQVCNIIWETMQLKSCMVPLTPMVSLGEAPTGGYNNGESTCFRAVKNCFINETCHEYFSRYLNTCMVDITTGRCRTNECMKSMRDVFNTVSPTLTHALVFCRCDPEDFGCFGLKSAFTPQCVKGQAPLPSCLTLKKRCETDPFCKASYQLMTENCAFQGNQCIRNYTACRAALVGTFGTTLSIRCECTTEGKEQELCLEYMNMFTSNPCVVKSSKAYFKDFSDDTETVSGCWVESVSNEDENRILMPVDTWVKICSSSYTNQQACLCSERGALIDCFDLSTNKSELCRNSNDERRVPLLRVAYSEQEVDGLNGEISGIFTEVTVTENLEMVIRELCNETDCSLRIFKKENGIIEYSTTVNCSHHLETLMNMINEQDPRIAHDLVLSVLKVAYVINAAVEHATISYLASQLSMTKAGFALPSVAAFLLSFFEIQF